MPETWLDLYRTMATAREIDRVELDLVRRGLAFFHVAGAGHEAAACLARHLTPDDWLHGVPIDRRVGIAHRECIQGRWPSQAVQLVRDGLGSPSSLSGAPIGDGLLSQPCSTAALGCEFAASGGVDGGMVGNAHPTLSDSASVGRLAKPSEASDGLPARPTEPLAAPSPQPNGDFHPARPTIFASRPSCALGGRVVTTAEIAAKIPGWTAAEAIKRTGVERRHWIAEGETAVSLATKAAAQLIDQMSWGEGKPLPLPPGEGRGEGGSHLAELHKISAIFCSTALRRRQPPSISCLVLTHLQGDSTAVVLLLTSEIISPQISNCDPTNRTIPVALRTCESLRNCDA